MPTGEGILWCISQATWSRDKRWESSQKILDQVLPLRCWDLTSTDEEANLQGFFWWFGKIRFLCLKRSAVWECLDHLAIHGTSPAASALRKRWHAPVEPDVLRAWLWCWDSELSAPRAVIDSLDKDKLITSWAWDWLEPGLFSWDADAPPLDNTQDTGLLPYHLCWTLGFSQPQRSVTILM